MPLYHVLCDYFDRIYPYNYHKVRHSPKIGSVCNEFSINLIECYFFLSIFFGIKSKTANDCKTSFPSSNINPCGKRCFSSSQFIDDIFEIVFHDENLVAHQKGCETVKGCEIRSSWMRFLQNALISPGKSVKPHIHKHNVLSLLNLICDNKNAFCVRFLFKWIWKPSQVNEDTNWSGCTVLVFLSAGNCIQQCVIPNRFSLFYAAEFAHFNSIANAFSCKRTPSRRFEEVNGCENRKKKNCGALEWNVSADVLQKQFT